MKGAFVLLFLAFCIYSMAQLELGAQVLYNSLTETSDMGGALWGTLTKITPDPFAFDDHESDEEASCVKQQKTMSMRHAPNARCMKYEISFETGLVKSTSFDEIKHCFTSEHVDPDSRGTYFYAGNHRPVVSVEASVVVTVQRRDVADISLGRACRVTFGDSDTTELVFVRDINPVYLLPADAERRSASTTSHSLRTAESTPASPFTPHLSEDEKREFRRSHTSVISERVDLVTQIALPRFPIEVSHLAASAEITEALLGVPVRNHLRLIFKHKRS